jgi:hypothetical protein
MRDHDPWVPTPEEVRRGRMPEIDDASNPAVERVIPPRAMIRIANPLFRRLLRSPLHGLVDEHLMLLHFRGRRSGREYAVVVGRRNIGGRLSILTSSPWRLNLRGGVVEVEATIEGERRRGRAEIEEDPDEVAYVYANLIGEYGYERAGRRLGIKINVDRMPTHEVLVDAIERSGLSVITIDLEGEDRAH